jgi:hypothetical protein
MESAPDPWNRAKDGGWAWSNATGSAQKAKLFRKRTT